MASRPKIIYFGHRGELARPAHLGLPPRPPACAAPRRRTVQRANSLPELQYAPLGLLGPSPPPPPPSPSAGLPHCDSAGRAEPLRMALAAAGVEFEFEVVDPEQMKSDLQGFHFAQVPR